MLKEIKIEIVSRETIVTAKTVIVVLQLIRILNVSRETFATAKPFFA
jgi:hypothetical protein